jgi:hypothetical protein
VVDIRVFDVLNNIVDQVENHHSLTLKEFNKTYFILFLLLCLKVIQAIQFEFKILFILS